MSHQPAPQASKTVRTERVIPAPVHDVFEAFATGDKLAKWWGPNGFRNTFEQFEFKPGGRWVFVMHGPNGTDYPNESVFRAIDRGARIVIEHVSPPRFTLTVSLAARDNGAATQVTWAQEFETIEVADRLRPLVEPANEQNLDRLQALLARRSKN